MCQEKKEEDDFSGLKLVWMHHFRDSKLELQKSKLTRDTNSSIDNMRTNREK